ncbi:MAG: hypothetical protein DRN37_08430 [Thermoplasmata archaeon]|nr:MAG: hypothetical protein DRN37_08430 [Thermoplasmata archaeon]
MKISLKNDPIPTMAYAIFELEKGKADVVEEIKKDDLISRQSIWTRDAASLGMEGEELFLKIEGDEQALKKAEELLKEKATLLEGDKKEEVNAKFVADDEKASEGMGFIFG